MVSFALSVFSYIVIAAFVVPSIRKEWLRRKHLKLRERWRLAWKQLAREGKVEWHLAERGLLLRQMIDNVEENVLKIHERYGARIATSYFHNEANYIDSYCIDCPNFDLWSIEMLDQAFEKRMEEDWLAMLPGEDFDFDSSTEHFEKVFEHRDNLATYMREMLGTQEVLKKE